MLNPGFSATAERKYGRGYVIPPELARAVVEANADTEGGPERRTQRVYGEELRLRLRQVGLESLRLENAAVMDACCGSGFLSYHLVQWADPGSLTLLDVSREELRSAERLIRETRFDRSRLSVECADLTDASPAGAPFDLVVGNSFLHHFPDVPAVLRSAFRLTRPGGWFAGLHEPTPAALPWESGDLRQVAEYFLFRDRYLGRGRHDESGSVREGTTDVWLFDARRLRQLLTDAGFVDVRVVSRYLLRPFFVAALGLHLSDERPRLTGRQERGLLLACRLDAVLRRVLPAGAFGGLAFAARRPPEPGDSDG